MTDPYAHIRDAFRYVTLGLMSWEPPPAAPWERSSPGPVRYRPWDPQGEVEPFDVQADWEERA